MMANLDEMDYVKLSPSEIIKRTLFIGDRVVFDSEEGINVPANKRKVGFLFQNYALWPNMTVYENISFGLTNVKEEMEKIDFDSRVNAKLVEILAKPEEVVKVLEECYDKKDKLDENKAILDEIRNAGIKIPLILAYGIKTPAQIQKCMSLGADGVLIGTVVLEAAASLSLIEFKEFLTKLRKAAVPV